MEDQADAGGSDGSGSTGGSGTRPSTEELLLCWTKCPFVHLIRSLNRSPSTGQPNIQFSENLHGHQHLQVQNLNQIQRMDPLTRSALTIRQHSLSSLSQVSVSRNPASSLPHIQTLDRLDEQPITEERGHVNTGEMEQEVDIGQSEQSHLQKEVDPGQSEQRDAITRLHQQEETNPTVTDHAHTPQHNHKDLEQNLHAKTQLQDSATYIGNARHILTSIPSSSSSEQSPLVDDCRTHGRTDKDDLKMHNHTEEDTQQQETTTNTQEVPGHVLSPVIALESLRDEAEDIQKDKPDTQLHSLDTTDTQPNQRLVTMNGKQTELEGRLDDTLSRIAMETQEIKELEQQLTDGQILVNEVLQKDLEDIICGLQQSLRGLSEQAHDAEQQIQSLKIENQGLQLHLEDSQRHCRQLEGRNCPNSQLLCVQQRELSELHSQAHTLKGRQVELEAELQRLRDELICQLTLGQDKTVILQQTVQKLQTHLDQTTTQVQQTRTLQKEPRSQMDQVTASTCQDQQVHGGLDGISSQDLGLSMETQRTTTSMMQNKDHMLQPEAQLYQDEDLELASDWRLKEEVQGLRDGLQQSQTRTRLIQQNLEAELQHVHLRLEDVQQERDNVLSQLRSQSNGHQRAMERMDRKLRRLSRAMCESDQLMADQLRSTIEELTHMNHSMDLIKTQKTENADRVSEQTQTVENPKTRTKSRASTGTRTRDGGQWCVVPGVTVLRLGSQETQDSGLSLQYLNSPVRGPQQHTTHAEGQGHSVSMDTGSEWSDAARISPPGPGPDPGPDPGPHSGLSRPQTPLVCPSCRLSASLPAEGALLHCNIPEHRDLFDNGDSHKLDEEKKRLRLESKYLRRTLKRYSRVKLLCEEVECVEETLLKRQAELREADELLLEARSRIQTSRDQVELMELNAEDHTTALKETQQHLRELQEEAEELRTRKLMEDQRLKEMDEELKIREEEKRRLDEDAEVVQQRLSQVSSQCLEAQRRLDSVGAQVQQEEQSLIRIRIDTRSALRMVDELRDQERQLHTRVQELSEQQEALAVQTRATVSAQTEDQQTLSSLQREISSHRAELKQVLQKLLSEQQTLEDLKSKRNRNLRRLHRKKDGLETMKKELMTTKDELDKMDREVDRKKEELTALQQEVESHRKKVESCLKETEQRTDLKDLQEELSRSNEERRRLQDQCRHLEARRRHAHRCLSAVEAELTAEREEHNRTQLLKQQVIKETAAIQQQLKENSDLLSLLSGKVEEKKKQLQNLEQETGGLSQQQQQRKEQLTELDREIQHKQMVCVGLEGRGRGLEDRGHRLDQQQLQLKKLRRELQHKEEELQQKEEELQKEEEGLQQKEEELQQKEEGLQGKEEELQQKDEELQQKGDGLQQKEEELQCKEDKLQQKEEGLQHKEEELQQKEEGLRQTKAGLHRKLDAQRVKEEALQRLWEELHEKDKDVEGGDESQDETFYLSTAGPRSVFDSGMSPEFDQEVSICGSGGDRQEPRWAELQTENLRRVEDRLKARLRCRLWTEQENLKVKGLEAQESLLDLRQRLDRLDSLLAHTH